jgi:putative hydrolase of the HAD superfamily
MPHNSHIPLIKQLDVIAFDADDTLWRNESLFWDFKDAIKAILAKHIDVESQKAVDYLDEMEINNIGHYGYGLKSYTLSMIEATIKLTDGIVDTDDIKAVLDLLKEKLNAATEVFIGVEETLMQLHGKIDMMLITKGDAHEQHLKINASGLANYFRWIEVVPRKDEKIYEELLRKYSIKPEGFMMVGNSLRSDVLPVCRLGGIGVHIANDTQWAYENQFPEEWKSLAYEKLDSILDLIPFLY